MSLTLGVLGSLQTLSYVVPERSVIGILQATHLTTRLPAVASCSASRLIDRAVRSCMCKGTPILAIGFAKFLFDSDPRRVIPPRNNALAARRSDLRPPDGPPTLTEPDGAAGESAPGPCPILATKIIELVG